jgi:hypothetical protein
MTAIAVLDRDVGVPGVATYSVSIWDHETECWDVRDSRVTKWGLRCWLRRLYAESWDHVSILVERNAS